MIARIGGSVADRLAAGVATLAAAGVATARLDAEWLLAEVLGVGRFHVYLEADREIADDVAAAYEAAIVRRAAGEPLQYILGWESFRGLRVRVTPDVLIPRPETELLVEWALSLLPPGRRVVVDVGTGSGCIALAVADARPDVHVVAVDLSLPAARLARNNVHTLGLASQVDVVVGDILGPVGAESADLVIANPPYLPDPVLPTLPREVRDWEPALALAGGTDGLVVVRRIVDEAWSALTPGGWLVLETAGEPHVDTVAAATEQGRYSDVSVRADLTGTRRLVAARRTVARA